MVYEHPGKLIILLSFICLSGNCYADNNVRYTENSEYDGVSVMVPAGSEEKVIENLSSEVRPSARQFRWQKYGMLGFIHFNLNTYTGREWGSGKEDLSIFNPTMLDAEQWVKTFKEVGITTVILVCKHHDGFCLWPSKYRERSVVNTPWRDGKGDVVAEVAEACRKFGMRLAVYYSPWDMQSPYGKPEYNDVMVAELTELLTQYGYVDLVWFDSAGIDPKVSGKKMDFDWQRIYSTIRRLQPQALISGAGPDIRWVGNEGGRGRFTEWSVQGIELGEVEFSGFDSGVPLQAKDLGNLDNLVKRKDLKQLAWYPARGGLPVRHGWFWKRGQKVRTLEYMVNSYFDTVGQNSNLLVNLSPNPQGLIPQRDADRMKGFGDYLRQMYSFDYANGATAVGNPTRNGGYSANYLFDDNISTCWITPQGTTRGEVEVKLFGKQTFNVVHLGEAVRDYGQRIESFEVDAWIDGQWNLIGKGTTIGFRRLLRVPLTTTERLRIRITDSRNCPSLASMSLYIAPKLAPSLSITRSESGLVEIIGPEEQIYYTTNGSIPDKTSELYNTPFPLVNGGLVRAISISDKAGAWVPPASESFGLLRSNWSTDETDGKLALDSNPDTVWTKDISKGIGEFIIDIKQIQKITGLGYLPPQNNESGHISKYEISYSIDGNNWNKAVVEGLFSNVKNNPIEQFCWFQSEVITRYIKFSAFSTEDSQDKAGVCELYLYSHKAK